MQIKSLHKNSDLMGMVSAGLCLIHCIALPVFLLSTTLTAGLFTHNWHWLDYFFIGLACVAVYFSAKKNTSPYLRTGMWTCVIIFAAALLSHEVSVYAQYVSIAASIGLMVLHFVNIRYYKRCSIQKVNV
jgi:hypothetical protein